MDNKDKLLLVFYIHSYDPDQFVLTSQEIREYTKTLTSMQDTIVFILPDTSISVGSIKLECVNPKLLDNLEYEQLKNKLEEISKQINSNINDSK